jgi:hypothetical protein
MAREAIAHHPSLLWREPMKTLTTLAACAAMRLLPQGGFSRLLGMAKPALAGQPVP